MNMKTFSEIFSTMKSENSSVGTHFSDDSLSVEQGRSLISELKLKSKESPKLIGDAYEVFIGVVDGVYYATLLINKESNVVYFSILRPK